MGYIFYKALIVAETADAILIEHEDLDEHEWLPRSGVMDGRDIGVDDEVDVEVKDWLARQRGWI